MVKKNQTIKILTILLTILLFSLTVNALGTIVIDGPAANEVIADTPSINMTIANAGGPGVTNISVYYRATANSSNQVLNTTITNRTENQTEWKLNLTTTDLEDSTIELIVNATYNNGTLAFSDTNTGIVIHNNALVVTLTAPAAGTVTKTRTQTFTATTDEEISTLRFIISNVQYEATGTSDGKSWTATVENLNPTIYDWDITTADQGDTSTVITAASSSLLTIQSSSTTIMRVPASLAKGTTSKKSAPNIGAILLIILIGYFVTRKKGK